MMKFLICMAVVATLAFAGCGEDDDSNGDSGNPSSTPGRATQSTQAAAGVTQQASNLPTESDGNAPGIPPLDAANTQTTPSGLKYIDEVVGDGASPEPTSQVTIHYTGWLTDGTKFDSSVGGEAVTYPLNGFIRGWQEGLLTMQVGGKRRLIVPAALGYAQQGSRDGSVPPNATMIFDVELIQVQ